VRVPPDTIEAMSRDRSISETEELVRAKLGGSSILHDQMAVVSNVYRAATAVRQHMENSVLRAADLTWTAWTVLWVLWIHGEMESHEVATEAGISKGTLTGVVRTLRSRNLLHHNAHPTDGRRVLLSLTPRGDSLMHELFPAFNAEEAFVAAALTPEDCRDAADALRRIVAHVETFGEERRLELLAGSPPAPRRSGRRARNSLPAGNPG
jgi:DNA-binding MarR family transcriptional regulator